MSDTTEITVLLCGRSVPTSLYRSLHKHVLERAPELVPGKPYPLKKICDEHYWNGLHGYKTYAGLVMADLVDEQLVPYFFASERDAKPLWYRLKP
jgi:hypothetical protein